MSDLPLTVAEARAILCVDENVVGSACPIRGTARSVAVDRGVREEAC